METKGNNKIFRIICSLCDTCENKHYRRYLDQCLSYDGITSQQNILISSTGGGWAAKSTKMGVNG